MYHPTGTDRFLLGLAHVLEIGNWIVAAFGVVALFPTLVQRAFFTVFALRGSYIHSIYGWSLEASSLNEISEVQRVVFLVVVILTVVLFAMACHYAVALLSYAAPVFRHDDVNESTVGQAGTTPFTESNVVNIRHIANYLLAAGIIQAVLAFMLGFLEGAFGQVGHSALGEGLEPDRVPNPIPLMNDSNSMEIMLIVVAVLVFCIARMFEYGVKLQEADDELI